MISLIQFNVTKKIIGMRFSIPYPGYVREVKIIDENARNEWLKNRIDIFNNVTYPSLSVHKNIFVLLFFGSNDQWVYESLDCYNDKRFIPNFSDYSVIEDLFDKNAQKYIDHGEKVILMRMDSDDAIHENYFDGVDQEKNLNKFVIQSKGIKWNGTWGAQVEDPQNQFIAIYTDKNMSPYGFMHREVLTYPHFFLSKNKPMWLTHVHGRNIANFIPNNLELSDIDVSGFHINPLRLS
jgi:hypothetical protein